MVASIPKILVVAGSDSGGGAGIQADIKTIGALGGYATTAITALTAQNTQGVQAVHPVPENFVWKQVQTVLEDIGADIVKTGMLHSRECVEVVSRIGETYPDIPMVIDPVMVSTSGATLLESDAVSMLVDACFPKALLITPNIAEAEILTGLPIKNQEGMLDAARALLEFGSDYVLVKGGHLQENAIVNILAGKEHEPIYIPSCYIDTKHTHGTGCTLASAIACFLGQGIAMEEAIQKATDYVHQAILKAPGIGKGNGPLQHFV